MFWGVVYSHTWFTKFNERTKHIFIKIYLSFYSRKGGPLFVVSLRDRWRDIYSDFFLSHIFFQEPGGCQHLHPLASRVAREVWDASDWLHVAGSNPDSLHCLNLTLWSPSGYTPVGPDCPDALSSPCLLITTWQLVKAHGVTRNKPKIHVI